MLTSKHKELYRKFQEPIDKFVAEYYGFGIKETRETHTYWINKEALFVCSKNMNKEVIEKEFYETLHDNEITLPTFVKAVACGVVEYYQLNK